MVGVVGVVPVGVVGVVPVDVVGVLVLELPEGRREVFFVVLGGDFFFLPPMVEGLVVDVVEGVVEGVVVGVVVVGALICACTADVDIATGAATIREISKAFAILNI